MEFIKYNISTLPFLEKGDMIKISQLIENAYCHHKNKFVGLTTEHFWCEIKNIRNNNRGLIVMVSNYCTLSISEKELPFQFGNKLLIDKSFIKEHKKNIVKLEHDEFIKNINKINKIIHSLPIDEKMKILKMPIDEKMHYFNQNYMIKNM